MIDSRSKLETFLTIIVLFTVLILSSPASTSLASGRLKQVVSEHEPGKQEQQILSTVVNLRDFGAAGDSVTDDAPALQHALNALADAGGGTLRVPAGHYLLRTPVVKQFLPGQLVSIEGEPSSTVIDVAGNGKGLDLTSEFIVATGEANDAIQLRGLGSLLMTDVAFVGVQQTLTDAHVVLFLIDVSQATLRHCEFYGLASLVAGGAIVAAHHTDLRLQETAFLGCATNSGVRTSVVQNTSWFGVSVSDCKFVDYGLRPDFFSKTPLAAPYSWVMVGDAAQPLPASSRREAVLDHVFLDEGAFIATTVRPDLFGAGTTPVNIEVYLSRLYVNVTNLGASGIYMVGAQKVFIDRSLLGWSHNADKAILLSTAGEAVFDLLDLSGDATRLAANAARLTVINSPYTSLDSTGPYTRVFSTDTPEEDPAQYVRQQYLSINHEPDRVGHFYWTNRILHCESDSNCIHDARAALAAYLAGDPPARFAITGRVIDEKGLPIAHATVVLTNSHSVDTQTDDNGGFAFSNLPTAGEYLLTVSKNHYAFANQKLVTPTSDQGVTINGKLLRHTISGHVVDVNGRGLADATLNLVGAEDLTTGTDAQGYFTFANLPAGDNYVLNVSRKNYSFANSSITFADLSADQTADFDGSLVSYVISGKVTSSEGIPLDGVTMSVTGSSTSSVSTDSTGYSFTLLAEGTYTITPTKRNYYFTPTSIVVNSLSNNQIANFTALLRPMLVSAADPSRALAIESVLGTSEPFDLNYDYNWGVDRRMRLTLFATNFQLAPGESTSNITAELEDASHRLYPLLVEYADRIEGTESYNRIIVRLNDGLTDVGDVLVRIKYRGVSSEPLIIGIGHIGGGVSSNSFSNQISKTR